MELNEHEQTRNNLLDALHALGIDTVADPFMPIGELIYHLTGALAAQLAADVHGSITADTPRSTALAAFAGGWAGIYREAGADPHEQASRLAILADCLAAIAGHITNHHPSPYAPVSALAFRVAGTVGALTGDDLPAPLYESQRDQADDLVAALSAAWATAREADRS